MRKKNIHIVGTGTIGLPLTGLFARHKEKFNIGEVTFHKNTPLIHDLANVRQLLKAGAKLTTDTDKFDKFHELGIEPLFNRQQAIDNADVIIDCTPAGQALKHKQEYYLNRENRANPWPKEKLYIAQGSEKGFGKIFAYGINNDALEDDTFLQVASCNTHAGAALIKACATLGEHSRSDLVYIRRSNDVSQNGGGTPSIKVEGHNSIHGFGTHHARDVHDLFRTIDRNYPITSSACKINSQLMHTVRFDVTIHSDKKPTREDVIQAFKDNDKVALTYHKTANKVFSHGREFGYYGRILNHVVVPVHTIDVQPISKNVRSGHTLIGSELHNYTYSIKGYAFTPQDGNSLLSSVSAALWFMNGRDWKKAEKQLECLKEYLFEVI
jgi:glyceraldehyde-3-phosphate dehydrogenase (NAD(P))